MCNQALEATLKYENIDKYVTVWKVLASPCNFGDIKDSLMRDCIVCGINNATMREITQGREPDAGQIPADM